MAQVQAQPGAHCQAGSILQGTAQGQVRKAAGGREGQQRGGGGIDGGVRVCKTLPLITDTITILQTVRYRICVCVRGWSGRKSGG